MTAAPGGVRLHVVTGKGGTGKTTVAAALALALAAGGRRSLLIEVESRQGIAQLFDTPPLPYHERLVAPAPGGGEVLALAVDPEEALLEYLELFYNLRRAGRTLKRLGAVDFATTIAPGLRDVLLIGKVKEAVVRRDVARASGMAYDAVVLDAPPTGRIGRFLNVSQHVGGLAKVGPIKTQSDGVMTVLRDPATAVHFVTLLEEMPVQETLDGVAALRADGLPTGAVIVNMTRPPLLPPSGPDADGLSASLRAVGLPSDDRLVAGLLAEAADHRERLALEERGREQLLRLDLPLVELPLLPDAIDLAGLSTLAEDLDPVVALAGGTLVPA